jgi:ribosomal protein L29
MKKQVKEELKTKTKEELLKSLKDVRKEISKLSLDISLQKEKNTALLKTKKKTVTRILTFLNKPQIIEDKK